jgi:hypothetical protein
MHQTLPDKGSGMVEEGASKRPTATYSNRNFKNVMNFSSVDTTAADG